jgi:hypothetical protein
MSSGADAAAVSLNGTVRVTNREAPGSHRPQASSEGLPSTCRERVNELTDGTVCAVDAATRGRKSVHIGHPGLGSSSMS